MSLNLFTMNSEQRSRSIEATAAMMNLREHVIEKDYWIVWTLWRIFDLPKLRPHLTFKGGTSLSKVYGVIKRFSEDLDLSIEKDFFGFGNENSPDLASSRKKRTLALEELSGACSQYVQTTLMESLKSDFSKTLGNENSWEISVDEFDSDGQTLLFSYPSLYQNPGAYVRPSIRLEMGARSEHWPVSEQRVQSFVKERLKENVEEPEFKIKVLNIERTFWEKATILHAYTHIPADKKIPQRLARHYYDMHCLIHSEIKGRAAADLDLLDRVVKHKIAYFASSWSRFETAKKGTLRLAPSSQLEEHLRADYAAMKDMFFEVPPAWNDIMESIRDFESKFNAS